jgi:hypothetical protein
LKPSLEGLQARHRGARALPLSWLLQTKEWKKLQKLHYNSFYNNIFSKIGLVGPFEGHFVEDVLL